MRVSDVTAIHSIARLRNAVYVLGAHPDQGWWRSQVSDPATLRLLGRIVPKTAPAAAALTAWQVCRTATAASAPGVRSHLFSLPTEVERQLASVLRDGDDCGSPQASSEEALRVLEEIAATDDLRAGSNTQRVVRVGSVREFLSGAAIQAIALQYLSAAGQPSIPVPYLGNDD